MITCRAPVRISFGGGGTDVSPYCEERGGCIISAAINKYAYTTIEDRDDDNILLRDLTIEKEELITDQKGLEYGGELDLFKSVIKHFNIKGINITFRNEIPGRSGLGSSASAFSSVIGAVNKKYNYGLSRYDIAELAYKLEREELKNEGGRQDQYASCFGDINFMEFKGNDFVKVVPLELESKMIYELEKTILLFNIGDRIASGNIIEDQKQNYMKGRNTKALDDNKLIAIDMKTALLECDLTRFGNLLNDAWECKKKFSTLITNKYIDKIYDSALKSGAISGKIIGAGGGGHMIFYCPNGVEHNVIKALKYLGVLRVPYSFDTHGIRAWES